MLISFVATLIAIPAVHAYVQSQLSFSSLPSTTLNATNLNLNSLTSEYTTLSHPQFPNHSIRIRKTDPNWCETSATSYTGYIDTTEARHIFFYFFESRSDPDSDDVILWTNGGPGCSSSLGLFMELGPCRISNEKGPKHNPHSWNSNANVFFIDQPIGTP
jgi:cathepsin A (carboxypeptidase C)